MPGDVGFIGRWRRAAGDLAVLLVFGQLVAAALYFGASFLKAETPTEFAQEIALYAGLYSLLSATLAIPVALLVVAVDRQSATTSARLAAAYTHFVILVAVILLSRFISAWLTPILHFGFLARLGNLANLVLIASGLLWAVVVWRGGWVATAQSASNRLRGAYLPVTVVSVVAIGILAVTGHAAIRPFGWWSTPAQSAGGDATRPDIYLITVDTLAAQDMSLYGYPLPTTPQLERFSRRAHVFDHYQANANWTQPTITTMMTGLYPDTHRCNPLHARLAPELVERTLPALLRANGYSTAAITSNTVAHPLPRGFGLAFDYLSEPLNAQDWRPLQGVIQLHKSNLVAAAEWWWYKPFEPLLKLVPPYARPWQNEYPAEPLVERTLQVTTERAGPRFVWTHFFAPHSPYLPPAPFQKRFLDSDQYSYENEFPDHSYDVDKQQAEIDRVRLRYDEFVAYADHAVGQLLDGLERQGLLDRSVVIVSADHGESFTHGWVTHHGPIMNQAVLHIPLLVHAPGQAEGRRIDMPGQEVDLLPTILDLAGLPVPDWAEGRSLVPAMQPGFETPERPLYSYELTTASRFQEADSGALAVVLGHHKLVHRISSGCEDLFDLQADPGEKVNLVRTQPGKAAELRKLLQARRGSALTVNPPADGQLCKLSFPEGL